MINESDIVWAIQRQGMILECDRKKLPEDKRLAMHRLLQSISRMDYQCLNKPVKWEDDIGEHTGSYHPMDLMHLLIKSLDIPSRGKLYQKLSVCKLALPVLFPKSDSVYMDISLRQVVITWKSEGHIVEGDVTNAPVPVISMIRCGQRSPESFSKSKLANDLLNFKCDARVGSCGFFTKDSLSSNNLRKVANGTVEGMWFQGNSDLDLFPASFGLLNLRGDALQHIKTATTLVSCSDIVFMFCDASMFGNTCYERLLLDAAEISQRKKEGEKKLNKLFVVFNRDAKDKIKENRKLFKDISETVTWKKVRSNYQIFLSSIIGEIQNSLRYTSMNFIKPTLNFRLRQVKKESIAANVESAKHITDSILKIMDTIKNADQDQQMAQRELLFPLQYTTKDYAKTQRQERRTLNTDKKIKLGDELITFRKDRYQKIEKGLPKVMSSFLRELFNSRTVGQELMFIRNIQYSLDDWCTKYLFDIRMKYSDSLKRLTSLKEKEIELKKCNEIKEEMQHELKKSIQEEYTKCTSLSKLLLDLSVGIESIFREIGEICETTKSYEESLIKELAHFNEKIPELVATLIMEGVAIEIMDGDGLSVPSHWLEKVMKALEKRFKDTLKMEKDPKIFVLTVLGTQSTGKSTLLNTMFGVQFPVSAGRCTKGAFMQMIPILLDKFPYDGLLIIDTEGLGAPEYRKDNTHDNEIATFVLGISDLAIINVRGEHPINIENFLQVSICALMRMSMIDFHPSVVFVHQNCDPSSKEKNLTGRHTFMKAMDEVVSTQARLIQKQDRFTCFQDIVDISLEDEKSDFVYFPQLLEGSPPMSPPSGDYSESCSNLTSYIVTKMQDNFVKYKKAQTFQEFAAKVQLIWKGVLDENFVLSLINSAEILVRYDIDNQMNHWKLTMENYMENYLESFCGEIKANFKAKESSPDILRKKREQLEKESHATNLEQKEKLQDHIKKQAQNQAMYKNWEQKCINKLERISERIMENCQRRLTDYYNHEKNDTKWRYELQQRKNILIHRARQIANKLIQQKEEETGGNNTREFTYQEIEDEFQKLWNPEDEKFIPKKEKTCVPDNVRQIFIDEIGSKYGHVANFQNTSSKFGVNLENEFKNHWLNFSHVEFKKRFPLNPINCAKTSTEKIFYNNIKELISMTETKMLQSVIGISEVEGMKRMHFQPNSSTFDCGTLVKQYLAKATNLLIQTHRKSQQSKDYDLTDTFKVMFLFKAAQLAVPQFEKAQKSFINNRDISTKMENERENIKQIFTLTLRKEETHTIAAKQITKRLQQAIKEAVFKKVEGPCKEMLSELVTQKMHVHGLVLHDIIDMLSDDISEENITYIQDYFSEPFCVFRKKISDIFDNCLDIQLSDMIKEKFDDATKIIKKVFENSLQVSEQLPLIEAICRDSFVRSLGIGEADFEDIVMPVVRKSIPSELNINCDGSSESEQESIKKEVKKRMQDETDIIEKLKALISENAEVNIDITLKQKAIIKEKIISDVYNHLFDCTELCPFCHALCDETHAGEVDPDSKHRSHCHRPMGFLDWKNDKIGKLVTTFCNDAVQSEETFENEDTNFKPVCYKEYRTVNSYYNSWDIDVISNDNRLYWKFIIYHITVNVDQCSSPGAQDTLSALKAYFRKLLKKAYWRFWEGISKFDAKRNINSLFHLDANIIQKNRFGFHYIKKKMNHSR